MTVPTQKTTGNLLIYGNPGTGKTMSFLIAKKIVETILSKKEIENSLYSCSYA